MSEQLLGDLNDRKYHFLNVFSCTFTHCCSRRCMLVDACVCTIKISNWKTQARKCYCKYF